MTVEQLIEILKEKDPDAEVVMGGGSVDYAISDVIDEDGTIVLI